MISDQTTSEFRQHFTAETPRSNIEHE